MPCRCRLAALALAAAFLTAGGAWARGSDCVFRSAGQIVLAFGVLDPSRGWRVEQRATALSSEDLQVGDCAPGQTLRLRVEGGLHDAGGTMRMKHALLPGTYLRYTARVTPTVQRGPGNRSYIRFELTGDIQPADLADAPGGAYSDVLRLSVTP